MKIFDNEFFNELVNMDALVKVNEYESMLMQPRDDFRLRTSELHAAGKVSDECIKLTRDFVNVLAERSGGRYIFEKDFRAYPHHVYSYSKGQSGRKQLYIGFYAYPPSDMFSCPWGVSIGLGFDFRNKQGIITECANEYEAFVEKVFVEPGLFDATFGHLGGYAEPGTDCKEPVTAEKVMNTTPDMLQSWLFFGRRLSPEAIMVFDSLEGFVDECIQVFDVIGRAGYYKADKKVPHQRGWVGSSLSFESFVTGNANELAHSAAIKVADNLSDSYNPLFIYGGVGLGKTHLLHAICNRFLKENSHANVCYVHATNFISDVIRTFKTNQFDEFKQYYNSLDLLLIDDIQFVADKPGSQQELLYSLNALMDTNKQVVIASNVSPNELAGFEPQLISRFGGGLTIAIDKPGLEMRVAILLKKFDLSNNHIGEDVALFIAKHVASSIRDLEGAHNRIVVFARFHKRHINIGLVQEVLKDLIVER